MFIDEFGGENNLTGEIISGIKIVQSFMAKESYLKSVSITFATYKRKNCCSITVFIDDDKGNSIARNTVNAKSLIDNSYHSFEIEKSLEKGRRYNLIIKSNDAVRGNSVTAKWGKSNHGDTFPVILDTGLTFGELACSFVYDKQQPVSVFTKKKENIYVSSEKLPGLIGITIPSYNCSNYIYHCLECIAEQTYNCFEVVVVDDGSDDATVTAKEVRRAEKDFNIDVSFISQRENKGANVVRNIGFYHTRGEYLLFLDADCYLVPNALEKYIYALKDNLEAKYAYCNYRRGDGTISFESFDEVVLRRRNFATTMSIIRREYFPGFDEIQQRLQDWDLWLTMNSMGHQGVWIDDVLFETPKRMDGITFGNRISFPAAYGRISKKHKFWDNEGRLNDITGLMVVYKTKDLFKRAYGSFRRFYPDVKLVVVDGSGGDGCTQYIKKMEDKDPHMRVIYYNHNIGHGPGMHMGINHIRTPYVYLFDSDTEMISGGVLELMLEKINENIYGVGKIEITNDNGINVNGDGVKYLHPAIALINKMAYLRHKPFKHHGAPCIDTMKDIYYSGKWKDILVEFPVEDYVFHDKKGTRVNYNNRWWGNG